MKYKSGHIQIFKWRLSIAYTNVMSKIEIVIALWNETPYPVFINRFEITKRL